MSHLAGSSPSNAEDASLPNENVDIEGESGASRLADSVSCTTPASSEFAGGDAVTGADGLTGFDLGDLGGESAFFFSAGFVVAFGCVVAALRCVREVVFFALLAGAVLIRV